MKREDIKKEAVDNIKRNLWGWGFKVKDVGWIERWDILVNLKFKVKVIVVKYSDRKKLDVNYYPGTDVIAVYCPGKKPHRFYARVKENEKIKLTFKKSPKDIFKGPIFN